jgi:hypothetical protein
LINDITDMIDELQSNMSAGAGNELESMMSRIAGRLLQSGLSSAATNAIMLEVERRDGDNGRGFSAEQWERIKKDIKEEREEQAKIAGIADDMNNGQQKPMTEQEWDEGTHNVAGMQMSGAQIDNVIQFMRDPRMRQKLIDKRAAELGGDTKKAEEQVNMTLAYLEAKKRIERGQGTDEDRAFVQGVDNDPTKSAIVRTNATLANSLTNNLGSNSGIDIDRQNALTTAIDAQRIEGNTSALYTTNSSTRATGISVASNIDPVSESAVPAISATFNQSANPEATALQPTPTLVSATPTGVPALNQNAGMI